MQRANDDVFVQEKRISENVQTMSWTDYANLATACFITHDHLLSVTHALHCAGSLMWFESSDELRQLVILDPR
jgi:hypothetical protein